MRTHEYYSTLRPYGPPLPLRGLVGTLGLAPSLVGNASASPRFRPVVSRWGGKLAKPPSPVPVLWGGRVRPQPYGLTASALGDALPTIRR